MKFPEFRSIVSRSRRFVQKSLVRPASDTPATKAIVETLASSAPIADVSFGQKRVHVSFWPYYKTNPYQDLLYGRNGINYTIEAATLLDAIARQSERPEELAVFHLHWLNKLIKPADSAAAANKAVAEFLSQLQLFLDKGGLLLWTIHNIVSHDTPHHDLEISLSRRLVECAHIIHVHGSAVIEQTKELFCIDPLKVKVAEHGNYIGVYRDELDRRAARDKLGLAPEKPTFLFFGMVRPYKGVDYLISQLIRLRKFNPDFSLVIAGEPREIESEVLRRSIGSQFEVSLHLRRIPDADIQIFMRASDFLVLPFRKVLTSGSAILGLSFGLPVIAPRSGLLPTLLTDGHEGFFYDPEDAQGLSGALDRALNLTSTQRSEMAICAQAKARTLDWRLTRKTLLEAIAAAAHK